MVSFAPEDDWYDYDDRYSRTATQAEAHAEWHLNAGVPMGQPGCPWDACHPVEDFKPDPQEGEGIRCAHCKSRHWTVADVKACAERQAAQKAADEERRKDSQWSWEYQKKWGRAENE